MKTLRIKSLLVISATVAFLFSCQKEADLQDLTNPQPGGGIGGNTNSIIGNWNFVGMTAITKTTITAGTGIDQEKIISSYGFNSQKNKGTVTIDANNFTSAGIGYSIDTVVKTDMYLGGVLFDSFESDFMMDMPLSSGTAPYKAVGTDSLFFQNGFIAYQSPDSTGMPIATTNAGYKISWLSDTLVLKTIQSNTTNQIVNGVNAQVANNISQIVKLKRQ